MGAIIIERDFRMAATMRFIEESHFMLGQARAWLRADPNIPDETRNFLSAPEPSFEYKLHSIAGDGGTQAALENNLRLVRRSVIALVLYDRMALCDRWLGDCQKTLPPDYFDPKCVRPLLAEYKWAQVKPWWTGGPVKGEGAMYVNKAATLVDGVYNGMIHRLDSLRATTPRAKNLPALQWGNAG